MGLARNSDLFKAGVDFHGVHDWSVFLTERPYFGNLATRPPDADAAVKLAWESSPDAYVSTWKSPVLLIQGDDDRNVPFSQTVDLGAAFAGAERGLRATGFARRNPRLPDVEELGARLTPPPPTSLIAP